MELLEKRVLYSADPLSSVFIDLESPPPETLEAKGLDDELAQLSQPTNDPATSLVIVDLSHDDLASLLSTLQNNFSGTSTHVVALDGKQDAYDQLTDLLGQYSELDSIHLLSHGSDGQLQLAGQTINSDHLKENASTVSQWGDALNEEGDLLLYGCNLSATQSGQEFALTLSRLMHADVASSDDITGHSSLNGNWDLEIGFGDLETPVILDQASQE